MHWLIFLELQRFAESKEKWQEWIAKANLSEASFYVGMLSDLEAIQLISAAAEISHKSINQFLKDFGKFIAPHLVAQFSHYINKKWDLLDFLEHTEEYIHKEVKQIPGARPPNLRSLRLDKDKVLIRYSSLHKMCAFGEGIIEQAAEMYNEKVSVVQSKCMLRGNSECEILVTRIAN